MPDEQDITELREAELSAYHRLAFPDASPRQVAEFDSALLTAVQSGQKRLADHLVAKSATGEITGAIKFVRVQEHVFAITTPRVAATGSQADAVQARLIECAFGRACERGAERVFLRVEADDERGSLRERLRALGFERRGRRIEYRTPVDRLPQWGHGPLAFAAMGSDACPTVEDAAAILAKCVVGDPDLDYTDDPLDSLRGFLDEPGLYAADDCVQIARLGDDEVGIVIAQTDVASGWSRVTYMGLRPEFRGAGLGK